MVHPEIQSISENVSRTDTDISSSEGCMAISSGGLMEHYPVYVSLECLDLAPLLGDASFDRV